MSKTVPSGKRAARERPDGRRQLLVYVDADLIKELKKFAVDCDTTASDLAETAFRRLLAELKTPTTD